MKDMNSSSGYLRCENCNGYYELEEGEDPDDFERCQCGGGLEFVPNIGLEQHVNEIEPLLHRINSSFGMERSIIIGVIVSLIFGGVYGLFVYLGFYEIYTSIIAYIPLISAGIVTSYLYYGDEFDSIKYAAIAGSIASILNFLGNILIMGWEGYLDFVFFNSFYKSDIIFLPDSTFYLVPSSGSVIIFTLFKIFQAIILGGILALIGGFIGIIIKNRIPSTRTINKKVNPKEDPVNNSEEKTTVQEKWDKIWQQRLKERNEERLNSTKKYKKRETIKSDIPWGILGGLALLVIVTINFGIIGFIIGIVLLMLVKDL